MMTPKRYDMLRLQLIRLYQAMEQHTDLAGEMFRDSTNPAETGSQDPSTFRVLPSIEGNRQHVRIKDRLPVVYSESPEIAEQVALDSSGTKSTVDFSEWLQEIAGQKGQRINPLHGMEMRIHLQKFEEELIYFIAFQERDPDRKGPFPCVKLRSVDRGCPSRPRSPTIVGKTSSSYISSPRTPSLPCRSYRKSSGPASAITGAGIRRP